jgi:hypothetical protein
MRQDNGVIQTPGSFGKHRVPMITMPLAMVMVIMVKVSLLLLILAGCGSKAKKYDGKKDSAWPARKDIMAGKEDTVGTSSQKDLAGGKEDT